MTWWVMKVAVMLLCLINATSAASNLDVKLNKLHYTFHTLSRNSFLPYLSTSASCRPSLPAGEKKGTSLPVIHKHGPCSPQNLGHKSTTPRPTAVEILEQDKGRVESIRNQINPKRSKINRMSGETNVMLPAKFGGGNFMVTVGLGTPRRDLSLIFDTGSSFTWTQCEPCSGSCYKQEDPIFDPSQSSTYSNIKCYSPICSKVRYSTTNSGCSITSSTCMYDIEYMDKSYSVGFVSKDTLYLGTKDDIVPNFIFGCGVDNQGLFDAQTAGLIGLGKSSFSLASQAASTYGNIFSYCLPSLSSSTGHLTLGNATLSSKAMQYTPLVPNPRNPSFYFIELQGIMVGGRKLSMATTVFSTVGTIIDSGTVISRLPGTAYSALRDSFRQLMSKYPKAAPISFLDTCYNFSNYADEDIIFPQISLLFGGGARLDLDAAGIFYIKDINQVCLAFAGNTNAGDVGVLGNMQQMTFDVVYDLAASRLGFGPAGCL